jgi:hypothetical protein
MRGFKLPHEVISEMLSTLRRAAKKDDKNKKSWVKPGRSVCAFRLCLAGIHYHQEKEQQYPQDGFRPLGCKSCGHMKAGVHRPMLQ